jgi:hypothetical protein
MNLNGTLFTFGCSMTSYIWPTWADILGKEFNKFENWGRPSAGNGFIFNSVIECLTKNHITKDDTVIIMWSGTTRHDFYQFNEWGHYHSVFDKNLPLSCPTGCEIINYAYFSAIEKLLTLSKINFIMLSWMDYTINSKAGNLYKSTLKKIKKLNFPINRKKIVNSSQLNLLDLYERLAGSEWPAFDIIFNYDKKEYSSEINEEVIKFIDMVNNNKHLYYDHISYDFHPTPIEHYNTIYNLFSDIISPSTKNWIEEIDNSVKSMTPYNFKLYNPERL